MVSVISFGIKNANKISLGFPGCFMYVYLKCLTTNRLNKTFWYESKYNRQK